MNRKKVSQRKRVDIYFRDNFTCVWCGKKIENHLDLTIDHLWPRCADGENGYSNMILSCKSCNNQRGDDPVFVFANKICNGDANKRVDLLDKIKLQCRKHIPKIAKRYEMVNGYVRRSK